MTRVKSKAYVDTDDEIEISLPTVSETRVSKPGATNDMVGLALCLENILD